MSLLWLVTGPSCDKGRASIRHRIAGKRKRVLDLKLGLREQLPDLVDPQEGRNLVALLLVTQGILFSGPLTPWTSDIWQEHARHFGDIGAFTVDINEIWTLQTPLPLEGALNAQGLLSQTPPSYGFGRYGFGFFGPRIAFRATGALWGRATPFFFHFSVHLSSVLGRTELCHEVWTPGPQKPQIISNENHHLALLDSHRHPKQCALYSCRIYVVTCWGEQGAGLKAKVQKQYALCRRCCKSGKLITRA